MTRTTKDAFTLSIAVHVLAVAIGFLLVLVNYLRAEEEPPVVFELFNPATETAPSRTEQAAPLPPRPVEPQPDDSPPPLDLPTFDDLRPVPEVPPPPAPEPPKPRPSEPEPAPRPKPEAPQPTPQPTPHKVSFEEWSRNRNLPARTQPAPQPKPRAVNVPTIQTDIRKTLSTRIGAVERIDAGTMSTAQNDALQQYIAALVARLQSVFQPIGANLSARVQFTLHANGSITNVRILRGSGDSAFDKSVLESFRKVRAPGTPPGNPPHTLTITFTTED